MVEQPSTGRRRWYGLLFIGVAVSMVIVDVTIINVAVPSIVNDLGLNSTTTLWVQATYTLTLAALLLTAGRLGDAVGRRRMVLIGVAVFVVGSVIAATAPTGTALVIGRFVQGIGGAAILPGTLSLINAEFRGKDRATAFAVWGSLIGGVSACGPLLGGWLTTTFSWRWTFGINIGLGAIAIAGIYFFVAESRSNSPARGLDPLGVVLAAMAPAAIAFGVVEGRTQGWWQATETGTLRVGQFSAVPMALALGVIAGTAFLVWETRQQRLHRPTLIDLSLFKVRTFASGNVVVFVVALGQLGLLFVLPLWLQSARGYTPTGVGLLLIALAVGAFLAAALTPLLAQWVGVIQVLRIGLVLEIVTLVIIGLTLSTTSSALLLVALLLAYGFGVGTAEAQLPGVILADVPVADSGQASGIQSTSQELGSALGIAVLGTVLLLSTGSTLANDLERTGIDPAQREQIVSTVTDSAGSAIPAITDPRVRAQAAAAFTDGARAASFTGAAILTLGLLTTISFRRRKAASTPSMNKDHTITRAS